MAEKYGTIPKKFTKEWWEYFWDYYKIHTIAALFIIILAAVTIYQITTSPKYDFNITYSGEIGLDENTQDLISEYLSDITEDIDGNGKKSILFQQLVFADDNTDPQYTAAMITKLQLEFVTNETMLFIFDRSKTNYLFGGSMEGVFDEVGNWLDDDGEKDVLYSSDGKAYAVSLKNSTFMKQINAPADSLYIAIRAGSDDDEMTLKRRSFAIDAAKMLIK